MVIELIRKELSKIKDENTKLLYLRRLLKKLKYEDSKREVLRLINDIEKKIKSKSEEKEEIKEEKISAASFSEDIFEDNFKEESKEELTPRESSARTAVEDVEVSDIREDTGGVEVNLEERLRRITDVREDKKDGEKEYIPKEETEYLKGTTYFDNVGEDSMRRNMKEFLKTERDVRDRPIDFHSLRKEHVKEYREVEPIKGDGEEPLIREYIPERDILSGDDRILESLGLETKKKKLYKEDGVV